MKTKILAVLATLGLLITGLAIVLAPAQAAPPERCPYTGCIKTVIVASGPTPIKRRQRANVAFKVSTSGNARPTGFVKVWVVQKTGERKYGRAYIVDYKGGRGFVRGDRVTRKGRYGVRAKYIPDSKGPFKKSVDTYGLRVTRR